jgi:hypothetical protein
MLVTFSPKTTKPTRKARSSVKSTIEMGWKRLSIRIMTDHRNLAGASSKDEGATTGGLRRQTTAPACISSAVRFCATASLLARYPPPNARAIRPSFLWLSYAALRR